jgi:hypothetical protein
VALEVHASLVECRSEQSTSNQGLNVSHFADARPHVDKSVDVLEVSNFAQSSPWHGALLAEEGDSLLLEEANVHFRPRPSDDGSRIS